MTETNILGKKLLFLTAHPDDESYLGAGTLYKNFLAGGQNALICSTLGEKGTSHLGRHIERESFKILRKKELLDVAALLHIDPLYFLHYPDGELLLHEQALYYKLYWQVQKFRPNYLFSFGEDGITGHHDHIALAHIALRLSREMRIPLLQFSLPETESARDKQWLQKRRKSTAYSDDYVLQSPNVHIRIEETIKWRSLQLHSSQLDDGNPFTAYPEEIAKAWLHTEYFVVAPSPDL